MNNDSSFLRPLSIFVSENFPGNIIDTSVKMESQSTYKFV